MYMGTLLDRPAAQHPHEHHEGPKIDPIAPTHVCHFSLRGGDKVVVVVDERLFFRGTFLALGSRRYEGITNIRL
jgi:hypothetical protein